LKRIGVTDENELAQLLEMEEERRQQNMQMVGVGVAEEQQAQVKKTGKVVDPLQQAGKARTVERQRDKLREGLRQSVTGANVPTKTFVKPKRVGLKRTPPQ